jgi:hypothetical protein
MALQASSIAAFLAATVTLKKGKANRDSRMLQLNLTQRLLVKP